MYICVDYIYSCHKRFQLACNKRRDKLEIEKLRRGKMQTNMGTVKFSTVAMTELEFALSFLVFTVRGKM